MSHEFRDTRTTENAKQAIKLAAEDIKQPNVREVQTKQESDGKTYITRVQEE